MELEIKYIEGPSLDQCYFYASDGKDEAAFKASDVVSSAIEKLAAGETQDKQLSVQPADYVAMFKKSCQTMDDFRRVAASMTVKNRLQVAAASEKDMPTWATEPQTPQKSQDEPVVAAEAGPLAENKVKTVGSPVPKYFAGLSRTVSDRPEIALDLQSRVQVLEEQLKATSAELDQTKKELGDTKKEHELGELKTVLTDLGVLKAPQDWDKYSKMLKGLDEKALGVVETILRDAAKGKEKSAGGPPKPPKAPGAPVMSPLGDKPMISAAGNLVHASLSEEPNGVEDANRLASAWAGYTARQDAKKLLG